MGMENLWNYTAGRKQKRVEVNLFQCHFIHQMSHRDWLGIEPWPTHYETEVILILYLDGRTYFIDLYSSYNKTSNYYYYYYCTTKTTTATSVSLLTFIFITTVLLLLLLLALELNQG
jgi:hypothetical protein